MRAISRMRCATRYLNRAVTNVSAVSVVSTLHIFKFSHFYREIMEEFNSGDEVGFSPDDASNAVKECIEGVIGGVDYSQNKVNQWTASIVEHSLTQLVKQGKAFKYIVNCAIMQKSGAGLHTANSCYWDTTTDGSCTVRWENRTMYCVVSVFAVAL